MSNAPEPDSINRVSRAVERITDARLAVESKRDAVVKSLTQDELDKKLYQLEGRLIDILDTFEKFILSESQSDMDALDKALDIKNEAAIKEGKALLNTAKKGQVLELFTIMESAFKPEESPVSA